MRGTRSRSHYHPGDGLGFLTVCAAITVCVFKLDMLSIFTNQYGVYIIFGGVIVTYLVGRWALYGLLRSIVATRVEDEKQVDITAQKIDKIIMYVGLIAAMVVMSIIFYIVGRKYA